MRKTATPFNKRTSTRLAAALGIVLAVCWGPLSHTLRLVEVSEIGAHGSESSFRIVLAKDCPLERVAKRTPTAKQNVSKNNAAPEKTERQLNAVPDTLESAQPIHFDLGTVPLAETVSAWIAIPERRFVEARVWRPASFDIETGPARGPPLA